MKEDKQMKIVHISLNGEYSDYWGYQENLIPKYQVKLGHDVSLITTQWSYGQDGKTHRIDQDKYVDNNNVQVIRLPIKDDRELSFKLKRFVGLYENLEILRPDIIFLHNLQIMDSDIICKYLKKKPNTILYVDNHCDYNNSARNIASKYMLHGILWKERARMLNKYARRFYGVTPARVDFLIEAYGLPKDKVELLVMGADDEKVVEARKKDSRDVIRKQYLIKKDDTVLLAGGKIDSYKPEILSLMKAIAEINNDDLKLLVFGSVADEYKSEFDELIQLDHIIYCGWIKSDWIYEYYDAADLVLFPGLHSVLWEQAVGFGKACIFRKIEGFTHVDIGGNCEFFDDLSVEGIKEKIESVLQNNKIVTMSQIAQDKGCKIFSYKNIAMKCIEENLGGKAK